MKIENLNFTGRRKFLAEKGHDVTVSFQKNSSSKTRPLRLSVSFNVNIIGILKSEYVKIAMTYNRIYIKPSEEPDALKLSKSSKDENKRFFNLSVTNDEIKAINKMNIIGYCDIKFDREAGLWFIEAEKNKM